MRTRIEEITRRSKDGEEQHNKAGNVTVVV
jgi:hypothetical protein